MEYRMEYTVGNEDGCGWVLHSHRFSANGDTEAVEKATEFIRDRNRKETRPSYCNLVYRDHDRYHLASIDKIFQEKVEVLQEKYQRVFP